MDIDIKTKLDALEELRKGAWEEFNNRRIYEWKMSLGIWTALTAFIALVLTERVNIRPEWYWGSIVILFIIVLHGSFMKNLKKSSGIDRHKQFFYEKLIMRILEIRYDDKLRAKIKARQLKLKKLERYPLCDWSERVQLSVTIILSIVALLSVYINSNSWPYKLFSPMLCR